MTSWGKVPRTSIAGHEPRAGVDKGSSWYEAYDKLGFQKLLNGKGLSVHQVKLMDNIIYAEFAPMGEKTTVCLLKHLNGFEVIGTSSCIDPKAYKWELGVQYALIDAIQKLDGFTGFDIHQSRYKHTQQQTFYAPASEGGDHSE